MFLSRKIEEKERKKGRREEKESNESTAKSSNGRKFFDKYEMG